MLAIRLKRIGRKRQPLYRLMISDKARDMYGDHLEQLGTYNPHTKKVDFKVDRIKHWLGLGATTSATVHNLLVKEGVISAPKVRKVKLTKKRQGKLQAAKAAAAPADTKTEEVATATPTAEPKPKAQA